MIAIVVLLATLVVLSGLDADAWRPDRTSRDAPQATSWFCAVRRAAPRRRPARPPARLSATPLPGRWWWE